MSLLVAGVNGTKLAAVDGCSFVLRLNSGFVKFCHLNGTLSCNENVMLALKEGCLSGAIAAVIVILVVIILFVCIICYYKHYKKRSGSVQSSERQQLLNSGRPSLEKSGNFGLKSQHTPIQGYSEGRNRSDNKSPNLLTSGHNQAETDLQIGQETTTHTLIEPTHRSPRPIQSASSQVALASPTLSISPSVFPSPYSSSTATSDATRALRNEERQKQMSVESEFVMKISKEMFKHKAFEVLQDIGSRLQKYWYRIDTRKPGKELLATVKRSKQCQLDLDNAEVLNTVKTLFQCIKHPYLQVIHDIVYKEGYVGILQEFIKHGSIRDHLFKVSPTKDWNDKYHAGGGSQPFTKKDKIAKCGHQVLKAVEVLYDLGFSHIGQIHAGNVFISHDKFIFGGYENSLLGYRSSMYQQINEEDLLDKIDVIMFGHLMYEIITGQLLATVIPTDSDYSIIEDSELQDIIIFIFKKARENQSHKDLMKEISLHGFFMSFHENQKVLDFKPIHWPADVVSLLSKVFPSEMNMEVIIHKLRGKYTDIQLLPKMGWRFGKKWARVRSTALGIEGLLTAVAVPNTCPIFVDVNIKNIKTLLLLEHEYIFNVKDMDVVTLEDQRVFVVFQDLLVNGSLRDLVYKSPPLTTWASKYKGRSNAMKTEQILLFGAQILQAMYFLSHLEGSDENITLGFVHTGNIFVEGNVCRLGGFENALLGHQTGRHFMFEHTSDNIDVLMFGHVIFEMSTGKEITAGKEVSAGNEISAGNEMMPILTKKVYKDVPKRIRPILKHIFEGECSKIEEIMQHFDCAPVPPTLSKPLSDEAKFLLQKVRKGKARDQSSYFGRGKHFVQAKYHRFKRLMPKIKT